MKILLDAMGGDNAPDANIKGAIRASKEISSEIVLVGNEEIINARIKELYGKNNIKELSDKITIRHCTETIEMEDIPTMAIILQWLLDLICLKKMKEMCLFQQEIQEHF